MDQSGSALYDPGPMRELLSSKSSVSPGVAEENAMLDAELREPVHENIQTKKEATVSLWTLDSHSPHYLVNNNESDEFQFELATIYC